MGRSAVTSRAMKLGVIGLAIVGALLVVGGAAGLLGYQSQQSRTIAVYKTPT